MVYNYFMAIAGRVRDNDQWRYFTGYFIDTENAQDRFDLKLVERSSLDTECRLSKATCSKYKIATFSRKEHIKAFQQASLDSLNDGKTFDRYVNFKRVLRGLFMLNLDKRGVNVNTIDRDNIQYIIGQTKE